MYALYFQFRCRTSKMSLCEGDGMISLRTGKAYSFLKPIYFIIFQKSSFSLQKRYIAVIINYYIMHDVKTNSKIKCYKQMNNKQFNQISSFYLYLVASYTQIFSCNFCQPAHLQPNARRKLFSSIIHFNILDKNIRLFCLVIPRARLV